MNMQPCPFCGSTNLKYMDLSSGNSYEGEAVVCKECWASGPVVYVHFNNLPVDVEQRALVLKARNEECYNLAVEKWNNRKGKE